MPESPLNENLSTFKYTRRVDANNLWNTIPGIQECRGHTYDNRSGEVVLVPPTKTFKYGESGNWVHAPLDTVVTLYKKYNGYMATMSRYEDKLIVGTSSSTNSIHTEIAKQFLEERAHEFDLHRETYQCDGITLVYEICNDSDTNVIQETQGAHLLGMRFHQLNVPVGFKQWQFVPHSNDEIITTTLEDAIQRTEYQRGVEGWMVYNKDYGICKLRTDYYIGKKLLMQATQTEVDAMYAKPKQYETILPQLWKYAVGLIVEKFSCDEWKNKSPKQKRIELETFEV